MNDLSNEPYVIRVSNCNNIDGAKVEIVRDKLNIKYALNGTGKSTIIKALRYKIENEERLIELEPFKYRGSKQKAKSSVEIVPAATKVMCFDEDYVEQFLFTQDELRSNSFEVFVNSNESRALEQQIESLIGRVKNTFVNDESLISMIDSLSKIKVMLRVTNEGIAKNSKGLKALSKGNVISHVSPELEPYRSFIQGDDNIGWIDWQTRGYTYLANSHVCPFCALNAQGRENEIKRPGEVYDRSTVENLVKITKVLQDLGEYLSEDVRVKISEIVNLSGDMQDLHTKLLTDVVKTIEQLLDVLETLRDFKGFDIGRDETAHEYLLKCKIDLTDYPLLNSVKTNSVIESINKTLEPVIVESGTLQGLVNRQRRELVDVAKKNENAINDFLRAAGYKYKVVITGTDDQAKLILQHVEYDEKVQGGMQHLSYGERNAFAVLLFMYDCLAQDPDIILLDDPISSFDTNKKFAVLDTLFGKRRSSSKNKNLRGKTVLLVTHDVEPIIDVLKAKAQNYADRVSCYYLRVDNGKISEMPITKGDLKTFHEICMDVVKGQKPDIIKVVYLRRHYEIHNPKGDEYQVLSNLLHTRDAPGVDSRVARDRKDHEVQLSYDAFECGCNVVRELLKSFDYDDLLRQLKDQSQLLAVYRGLSASYDKLQVFRLLRIDSDNLVHKKFVDETYHIENELICQLDPNKYDLVPEYVVRKCDAEVAEVESSSCLSYSAS